MWPITSASASSTTSASIRPEPGIEGPPVWIVLWMPYLRAQATIRLASSPCLTPPRPTSPSSLTPASASSRKSLLDHACLEHRGAGVQLDPARAEVRERALGRDRQRLDPDHVPRPSRQMDLARRDHRRDAAVQEAVDPVQLALAGRPVAEHRVDVAVDQAGGERRALGIDDDVGVRRHRRPWPGRPRRSGRPRRRSCPRREPAARARPRAACRCCGSRACP